jgi:hypothetical protein
MTLDVRPAASGEASKGGDSMTFDETVVQQSVACDHLGLKG